MKKIIQFIKYNNAFTIIISLVMFSAAGAFANETSRSAIIGKTIITRIGVDNSQIVGANLGGFNMDFKITKVTEDDRGYSIGYSYNTIYIKDNVWQPIIKEGEMYVAKISLGDKDLGLYIAEELGQKADYEIAYLKEVQAIEKSKGTLKQTESVEYTGLKGLVFDGETKEIVGYNVAKEESQKAEVAGVFNPITKTEEENKSSESEGSKITQQITVVKELVSKETIMQMVREAMNQEKVIASSSSSLSTSTASSSSSTISSSSSSVSGGSGGSVQSSSESSAPSSLSESSNVSSSESSSSEATSSSRESSSSISSAESSSSSETASSSSEAVSSSSNLSVSSSSSSESSSSQSSESSSSAVSSSSISSVESSSSSSETASYSSTTASSSSSESSSVGT